MRFKFILSNLACGSLMETPKEMGEVLSQGITHIINLQIGCDTQMWYFTDIRQKYPDVEFLHLYFADDRKDKPFWVWNTILEYAHFVLATEPSHKIFVHCALGESRSPAVVYLLLRKIWGYSKQRAKELLRKNYFKLASVEEKYEEYLPGIEMYLKHKI